MVRKPKKQVIYEAAARLFQEKGYSAASMRDLAERVNLKASSLYSHIRKKEEILQKICFDNARRFLEGLDEIQQQFSSPLAQLEAVIFLHIDIALDDPTSITVFNDEWKHLEDPYLKDFVKLRKNYEQRLLDIIQEGQSSGVFTTVTPTTALNTMLTSLRWVHYKHAGDEPEKLRKDISALILGGIKV
ncbi:MAG: TetR/AcrR family transcriptional regulator [Bacteroidetes bacterium]|nr:TetR/AcrR family transcriptional regulator [Bacteroidota bacterium]